MSCECHVWKKVPDRYIFTMHTLNISEQRNKLLFNASMRFRVNLSECIYGERLTYIHTCIPSRSCDHDHEIKGLALFRIDRHIRGIFFPYVDRVSNTLPAQSACTIPLKHSSSIRSVDRSIGTYVTLLTGRRNCRPYTPVWNPWSKCYDWSSSPSPT